MARFTPGALFRIPVRDDHAYALMLASPGYVAFYGNDMSFTEDGAPTGAPLFIVMVTDPTYSGRKWGKPIRMVAAEALPSVPKFFRRSVTNKGDCKIIDKLAPPGRRVVSARPEDCVGLEGQAAWSAGHIESRILDACAGRPNLFAEHLKVKL
jgi:hypothetical protein